MLLLRDRFPKQLGHVPSFKLRSRDAHRNLPLLNLPRRPPPVLAFRRRVGPDRRRKPHAHLLYPSARHRPRLQHLLYIFARQVLLLPLVARGRLARGVKASTSRFLCRRARKRLRRAAVT